MSGRAQGGEAAADEDQRRQHEIRVEHDDRRCCQRLGHRAVSAPLASPCHRCSDIGFAQIEFRQLGANRIAALDADRRQDDLAIARNHIEIFGRSDGCRNALRKGELILGNRSLSVRCPSAAARASTPRPWR